MKKGHEGSAKTPNKSRDWLKTTLNGIEDAVAMEASVLRQKSKDRTLDYTKVGTQSQKTRSLDDLRYEQVMIREKLREIRILQKTTKQSRKQFKNAQRKVKTNSQLRQLTKRYREFKERLLQKSQIIKIQQEQYKEKTKKLEEEKIKTQCEQRRKVIEQTLKKMEQRRAKNQEEWKRQKDRLKKLRKQKLFEKMNANFNKKMNDINEQKIENYRKIRRQFSIDISSLSMHQKKYEELKHEKQQKRTLRMAQSRVLPEINHYKSRFMDQVLENDRAQKQRENQILLRARQIKRKHKQYEERVKEEFVPHVKEHYDEDEDKENKKIALDREQIMKKGNQLYKEGQKLVIPLQKRQQHQKKKQLLLSPPKPYPNYLPQILHKHSQSTNLNPHQHQLQKLKTLIKNNKLSKQARIEQVKLLIDKMEYTFVPNKEITEEELVKRLGVKMELLEMLQ